MKRFAFIAILLLAFSCIAGENKSKINFALNVIEENILTTDFTALLKVTKVTAANKKKLVVVNYSADILESFAGGEVKNIIFTEYIEKDEKFNNTCGSVLIVSLCKDKNGNYYLPDIGYELPAEDVLLKKAREVKTLIHSKKLSMRKDQDSYACGQ